MKNISFNKPLFLDAAYNNLKILKKKNHFSSFGYFYSKCEQHLIKNFGFKKVILTNSCTQALEFISLLLDIKSGDEVIVPSYTFVSTANAFVNFGAKPVFVDVDDNDCNIIPEKILSAITKKTKAVIVVHYAGFSKNIDVISKLCKKKNLLLIEDCAHSFGCRFKKKYLGTFGDFSTLSFHETKNIQCGEGGALIINNKKFFKKSELMKFKGTNRSLFNQDKVNKYSWHSKGSSFMMSDIIAAVLYSQLIKFKKILSNRKKVIKNYINLLKRSNIKDIILPDIYNCNINCYHILYFFVKKNSIRNNLLKYLNKNNINATFHYLPLHKSKAGMKYGKSFGNLNNTIMVSNRIVRLPLWNGLKIKQQKYIIEKIKFFFNNDK